MASLRVAVLALCVASSLAQLNFDSSLPSQEDPNSDVANTTDTPSSPDLGHMLMDLIGLAKKLSDDIPDHGGRRPFPGSWRQMGQDGQQGQAMQLPAGDASQTFNGPSDNSNDVSNGPMQAMPGQFMRSQILQGTPQMGRFDGQDQSPMSQQIIVMPFSQMDRGRMQSGGMMGMQQRFPMAFLAGRMFSGFGQQSGEQNGDNEDEEDDDNEEESDEQSHGRPHGRPMPRPDREDDESRGGHGHGGRPHGRPMPRPDRDGDDDVQSEGPHGRGGHGPSGRPHGRPFPRSEQDDDEESEGPSRGERRDGDDENDQDDESRPQHDGEEEDDPKRGEQGMGNGRRPGPPGRGGRGHGGQRPNKPKCDKLVRFLLQRLREKGGRSGRGGRGGRGGQGEGQELDGPQRDGQGMRGGMFGNNDNKDDSDSNNDMIFPKYMPFSVEGDDE